MASFCYRIKYELSSGVIGHWDTFDYLYNARAEFKTLNLHGHRWIKCWIERTDGRKMSKVRVL